MVNLADNRNIGAISEKEQKILNSKTVFIAGCGGLGCYCADMLSRLGIGHLVLCDCDEFEPSNLNRQLYCNYKTLGKNKAVVASQQINQQKMTKVRTYPIPITKLNAYDIIQNCDLVIDCLGLFGMEKRRLGALELCGLAVTALGIVLLLGGAGGEAPLVPVAVSVLSGTACVCTRQVTAQLSERTSLLTGTWYSYFTGSAVALAALGAALAAGAEIPAAVEFSPRAWIYLGGALGASAVYLQSVCVKRMSSVSMTLVMFAGQVFGGAVIDAAFYGEFSARTLMGGALAFAGLVLNALSARRTTARP